MPLLGALTLLSVSVQAAPVNIDIPPQSLAQALHELGRQADLQVLYSHDLVEGLRSPAVQGRMEPAEALERLLGGRGIRYSIQNGTITLTPMPQTTMLSPVNVVGSLPDSETYVATVTSAGTKTDTPLIEVPQSISVITAAQIREQNPQTLGDAVRYTPGIVVQEGFNRTDDPFIIRGFDVRTNPGVMFRDGLKVPLPHYSVMSEPYALDRIEVVKGPASVLYGQASPGGIVNVVSKRPTDTPLRELQLSGGSHDNKQLAGDFGGRIDEEGRLTYRLTGLVRGADTMIDDIPDDRYYLAPALTWRIGADTSLTLLASYMKNKTINNAGYPLEGTVKPNPNGRISRHRFTGEPDWSKWDQEVGTLGYQFAHRFNETWQFKQNLNYAQSRNRVNHVYWNTWVPGSNFSTAERGAYRRDDDAHGVSVDNQFDAKWELGRFKHNVLFGLDYTETYFTRKQYAGYNNLAPIDFFHPVYGSSVVLPSQPNTYTNEKTQPGRPVPAGPDQVRRQAGAGARRTLRRRRRQDAEQAQRQRHPQRRQCLHLARGPALPCRQRPRSLHQLLDLVPAADRHHLPATRDDPVRAHQGQAMGSGPEVPAQRLQLLRHGIRIRADPNQRPDGRSRQSDLQRAGRRSAFARRRTIGDGEPRLGLEPDRRLHLHRREVTKSNTNTLGNTPEAVPRNMVSLWSDYTVQSGPLAGLNFGGGVRYMGSTFNSANTAKVADYTLFDAAVRYDFGAHTPSLKGWTADLTVRNLFDKNYVASCTYACFYGEGRTVLGRVTYKW